ncbi:hypothetical protein CH354_16695 [Leptospira levettii]|nr:hypothetical protein CH354_16695 [Leptospira levettii]PJZ89932.1 hypothetical protein CH368_04020 [Leptospira levettii]PJZ99721.1 hypothetical protein CH369_13135 [Leptospira levettii]
MGNRNSFSCLFLNQIGCKRKFFADTPKKGLLSVRKQTTNGTLWKFLGISRSHLKGSGEKPQSEFD